MWLADLPSGVYIISDTLAVYFHTHIVGSTSESPGCRSSIVLASNATGFGDARKAKPMLATDNGQLYIHI